MKQEEVTRLLVAGVTFNVEARTNEGSPTFRVEIAFRNLNERRGLFVHADGESEDIAICKAAEKAIGLLEREQSNKLDELCSLQEQLTALRKIAKS